MYMYCTEVGMWVMTNSIMKGKENKDSQTHQLDSICKIKASSKKGTISGTKLTRMSYSSSSITFMAREIQEVPKYKVSLEKRALFRLIMYFEDFQGHKMYFPQLMAKFKPIKQPK